MNFQQRGQMFAPLHHVKTGGVRTLDGKKSQSITCLQQVRTGS
jgi:hypothetical protein